MNALFLPTSVNPTVWTIGHIIPAHTKGVNEKYEQGLCIVTMEGREAKNIALKKLSENTFYKRRWYEIFKHEFVMLVWLPEQGFNLSTDKHTAVYIPERVFSDSRFCYCNLEKASPTDEKCTFCGDPIMKVIQQSAELKKVYHRCYVALGKKKKKEKYLITCRTRSRLAKQYAIHACGSNALWETFIYLFI